MAIFSSQQTHIFLGLILLPRLPEHFTLLVTINEEGGWSAMENLRDTLQRGTLLSSMHTFKSSLLINIATTQN